MASLFITDKNGKLREKVNRIREKMEENSRINGMAVKVSNVEIIDASLDLMQQKLHIKQKGIKSS